MDFILFAMLGASIGWLNQMVCPRARKLTCATNILICVGGALVTEWLLVPLLGESAQKDFAVSAALVSLGAIVPSAGISLLRQLRQAPKSTSGLK
jgi:uncharacterized membrane protein YeaQ/YmgE (transglycosylase-associated protein family)